MRMPDTYYKRAGNTDCTPQIRECRFSEAATKMIILVNASSMFFIAQVVAGIAALKACSTTHVRAFSFVGCNYEWIGWSRH